MLVVPPPVFRPIPFLPAGPGGLDSPEFQPAHWAPVSGAEARLNRSPKANRIHVLPTRRRDHQDHDHHSIQDRGESLPALF